MSDIPPPIIVDILSRLPVKSLCRFRCVSKPWLALINLPRFAKMHLSRTHKQRLLFHNGNLLYSVQLETLSCLRNSIPVQIELPAGSELDYDDDFSPVIGSCNGLLCIRFVIASMGFLLYNPSTKEFKKIPDVIQEDQDKLIGFGYAESINDYKIVKIPLNENGVFKVYSLRKDSWISIESDFDFGFFAYSSSLASVNGAIHFASYYHGHPTVIAAFDLVEDKFKTIPPPPDFMLDKFKLSISVGHLSGCLCLLVWTISASTEIELWVMKEYGVLGSWTKIFRTKSVDMRLLLPSVPLCYLNNNETIFVTLWMRRLMFWDSEDEEFKEVEIGCIQDGWSVENVCTESLVSPNRINGFTNEDDEELLGYWFN